MSLLRLKKITNYYLYLGNSDVPYPVALSKNYVYLMLNEEKNYFEKSEFPSDVEWSNAYSWYYGWARPERAKRSGNLSPIKMKGGKKFKKIKVIHKRDTSLQSFLEGEFLARLIISLVEIPLTRGITFKIPIFLGAA